jgi:hypothetical protein
MGIGPKDQLAGWVLVARAKGDNLWQIQYSVLMTRDEVTRRLRAHQKGASAGIEFKRARVVLED